MNMHRLVEDVIALNEEEKFHGDIQYHPKSWRVSKESPHHDEFVKHGYKKGDTHHFSEMHDMGRATKGKSFRSSDHEYHHPDGHTIIHELSKEPDSGNDPPDVRFTREEKDGKNEVIS